MSHLVLQPGKLLLDSKTDVPVEVTPNSNNRPIVEAMDAGITSVLEILINVILVQNVGVMSSLPVVEFSQPL